MCDCLHVHGDRKDASLGVGLNKDHLYVCASVEEYGDAIAAQCQEEDVDDRALGVHSVGVDIPAAKYQIPMELFMWLLTNAAPITYCVQ